MAQILPGAVKSKQTYTNDGAKATTGYYVPGAPSYVRTNVNLAGTTSASDWASKNNSSPTVVKPYTVDTKGSNITLPTKAEEPQNDPIVPKNPTGGSTGSSSGSSSGGGDYSSSSSSYSSSLSQAEQEREDYLQMVKDLLAEQRRKAEEAYKARYEEELANNTGLWRSNADQINLNRARAERLSRNLYGEESGANNTNIARIGANWASSHNENNRNLATNNSTALTNYNTNLSNSYNTLANGYSNFVLPVYTNDINNLRELQYRREANAVDYDYRKFLAEAGLM